MGVGAAGSYSASTSTSTASTVRPNALTFDNIQPGIYVFAKIASPRGKSKKFVAMVERKYGNSDHDVFLKLTPTKFVFPNVVDRSSLHFSQILHVLAPPEMGRHTEMIFSSDFHFLHNLCLHV